MDGLTAVKLLLTLQALVFVCVGVGGGADGMSQPVGKESSMSCEKSHTLLFFL